MPELPEVEILTHHLRSKLVGLTIREVSVLKERSIRPIASREFAADLVGRTIDEVRRRAKYIRIQLDPRPGDASELLCHLGMTGRLFLIDADESIPKHAVVVIHFDLSRLVFQDVRRFGRMSCDVSVLDGIGPEPLDPDFPLEEFSRALRRRESPVKNLLLDQGLIAGVGNIYASEALFRAGILPSRTGSGMNSAEVRKLSTAIREVLQEAVDLGRSLSLDWKGDGPNDGLFYFGSSGGNANTEERFRVYGREGEPCSKCGITISRVVIGARGSFFCPRCQR